MVWKGDDIYVTQSVLLEMCQITYIVEAGWLPDENNAKNEEIITFIISLYFPSPHAEKLIVC